jgi:hypothetical protein
MTMMVCRAKDDQASAWILSERTEQGGWVHKDAVTSLENAIKGATLVADLAFTFTTRALDAALATYAENPDDLMGLGGNSHAVILCPEGAPIVGRWTHLHRVPHTGAVVGTGVDGRFRPQCLKERVLAYFVRHQWRSFVAPKIAEAHEPVGQQPHRPPHHRELLVRPAWAARQIAPDLFPDIALMAKQQAQAAAAQLTYQERKRMRNPRERRLALQATWAAERAAREADPEAAEAARKARFGSDWGSPSGAQG